MGGMKIDFNGLLYALSYALDCVEGELIGVSTGHSKRVAYMSVRMGQVLGLGQDELADLAACAVLHDNALTQYIAEEYRRPGSKAEPVQTIRPLGRHCVLGEENIRMFPFRTTVDTTILYHHENADGSGPFHKKEGEIHLFAALIHLGDLLDGACRVGQYTPDLWARACRYLNENRGRLFENACVEAFFKAFQPVDLETLGPRVDELLWQQVPSFTQWYSYEQIKAVIDVFAKITDYKSEFTGRHSLGVAKKAAAVAVYRQYDADTVNQLYIAGALHDIGKMAVHNDILEKPGKLTREEFANMKNHAWYTYRILSAVQGFEKITEWASLHHEKLDGSGYPFGRPAGQLDEQARLMACVDIYQALTEARPYKDGMSHERACGILDTMVENNQIDRGIVRDIKLLFGGVRTEAEPLLRKEELIK